MATAYIDSISKFCSRNEGEIFNDIATGIRKFSDTPEQKDAWHGEIELLQKQLKDMNGYIGFEYEIPRMANRVDTIVLYKGIIFVLEFKVGTSEFAKADKEQAMNYAIEIADFQERSVNRYIVPILIATGTNENNALNITVKENNIIDLIETNGNNLSSIINECASKLKQQDDLNDKWFNGKYAPIPTMIDATRILFQNNDSQNLRYTKSKKEDLDKTVNAVNKIVEDSKLKKKKSICFITGVPGAGKTLVGLKIAADIYNAETEEEKNKNISTYLSGNHPLVVVLRETLLREERLKLKQNKELKGKKLEEAKKNKTASVKSLIQDVYAFRNEALENKSKAEDKDCIVNDSVVIFDESQRAWNRDKIKAFMKKRYQLDNFTISEPEFLVESMDKNKEWSTIVCLVGEDQEINTGEIGIEGWFDAIDDINNNKKDEKDKWNVYYPSRFEERFKGKTYATKNDLLDLKVPKRNFKSDKLYDFVKLLLEGNDLNKLKDCFKQIKTYPIYITRDLEKAKEKIRELNDKAEENITVVVDEENNIVKSGYRYGLIASAGAKRLREFGVNVYDKMEDEDLGDWFLGTKSNIKSSYALETVATEFDIQGLELDYCIMGWDANMRIITNDKSKDYQWDYYKIFGNKWKLIKNNEAKKFLINSYRVLLTRARQGLIIFIPKASDKRREEIKKRKNEIDKFDIYSQSYEAYDNIYDFFKNKVGIKDLEDIK